MRSVRVYDEFYTLGIFNALWLSPVVRNAAIDSRVVKFSMNPRDEATSREFVKEQTEKYISFYILVHQPRWLGSIFGKQDSHWSLLLTINDQKYEPLDIKKLDIDDIDPVYRSYFGEKYNKHKTLFYVRFAATEGGESLFKEKTDGFTLCIRSYKRQVALGWELCNGPQQLMANYQVCGGGCNESGTQNCGACALCEPRPCNMDPEPTEEVVCC